ncbi:MAG TPA: sodium:calcium antiporter, partial [Nitriliruptorales bacterium]
IVGSNVANLSLVMGVAVLITRLDVSRGVLRREAPLSLFGVLLFAALVQHGLTRWEGVVLLTCLVAALTWIIAAGRNHSPDDPDIAHEVEEFVADGQLRLAVEVPRTLLGLVGTVISAQILIEGALGVSQQMGLAEGFVGLTIVAIGTSLPELATSIQAARKGEHDLIVGNLLGSNLFNSLAVGGVVSLAGPGPITDTSLTMLAASLMVVIAVLATVFLATERRLRRWEGMTLLAIYLGSIPFLA